MADQFNSPIQGYQGWNVNSPYLSPAYMANFRPGYSDGGMRDNPYTRQQSIGESLRRLGPGEYAYGADTLQETSANMYNITTAAGDAAASLFQNVGIPLAAWYGMKRINAAGRFQGGAEVGARMGARAGRMSSRFATGALGRGAGAIGLGGLVNAGSGMANTMANGASRAGAFAGGMFLPIMAGQVASSIADAALIDPYVSTRRGMDAMRANTANQFISGEAQTASGGFGMSATRAQAISQSLTEAGQADFSLTGGTYNEIADNMMRAGIFQEVGDMDTSRIVDGVKKATSVLKLISRVTGDPDIQAGIQTLATLKAGGLDDIHKMERAVNQLRGASASSGVSMGQLIDTIGNQGQVMAQQQGMRGVTGLLASADAFAGFTNARRAGIISGGQMQALGGAEGMTQNLMSGAYQTMNSGYGRMAMQGGSQFGTGVSNAIQSWGAGVGGDPIRSLGDWFANQGSYKERAMNDQGAASIAIQTWKSKARMMGMDPNDGLVLASMAQAEGLSSEEFRSIAEADRSRSDPVSRMRMNEAKRTSNRSDYVSELQQEGLGLTGIPVLGKAQYAGKKLTSDFLRAGAEFMSPLTETIAEVSDAWEGTLANAKGMRSDANAIHTLTEGNAFIRVQLKGFEESLGRPGRLGKPRRGVGDLIESDKQDKYIAAISRAMSSSDPRVQKKAQKALLAMRNGDKGALAVALRELDSSGQISGLKKGYEKDVFHENINELMSKNLIQLEQDSVVGLKVERNVGMEINEAMRADNPEEAFNALMEEKGYNNSELLQTLGIDPKSLKGSIGAQKMTVAAKAKKWYGQDMGDIEGPGSVSQLQKRMQAQGISPGTLGAWASFNNRDLESLADDKFNPWYGGTQEATHELAKKIDDFVAGRENDAKSGTGVDWTGLKDVSEGISLLGPTMQNNTDAVRENTRAIQNRDKKFKISKEDFDEANPRIPVVGGVRRSTSPTAATDVNR